MGTGRGTGVSLLFEVGIQVGDIVVDESFAFEVRDKDFLQFFAFAGMNDMPVKGAVLGVFFGVAKFTVEPGRHSAVDNRTADFAVDIADDEFIVADEDGFFPQVGFKETGALDDSRFIFVLLVDLHLDAGTFQADFRCTDGVFS